MHSFCALLGHGDGGEHSQVQTPLVPLVSKQVAFVPQTLLVLVQALPMTLAQLVGVGQTSLAGQGWVSGQGWASGQGLVSGVGQGLVSGVGQGLVSSGASGWGQGLVSLSGKNSRPVVRSFAPSLPTPSPGVPPRSPPVPL